MLLYFQLVKNGVLEETTLSIVDYRHIGDSLSNLSQQTLLTNVAREMKANGSEGAINFCSLNASALMDSLSKEYQVNISRISAKSRNEMNEPTQNELTILKELELSENSDTLYKSENITVYYKSIRIGMPTCLKCHGTQDTDISPETLKTIRTLYPNDIAINYKLGDFRGAWKIDFKNK